MPSTRASPNPFQHGRGEFLFRLQPTGDSALQPADSEDCYSVTWPPTRSRIRIDSGTRQSPQEDRPPAKDRGMLRNSAFIFPCEIKETMKECIVRQGSAHVL